MLERDADGFVVVRVKDLIAALQRHDPELRVGLDHDGWMENEMLDATDAVDLIEKRGVWMVFDNFLIINN